MIVELDIFSGRPNPSWQLSTGQTLELRQRVSALPGKTPLVHVFDGLGYRGLVVRDPADPGVLLKVGFGEILLVKEGAESGYSDEGRALERWLLATGKGKIDDRLIAAPNLD